MPYDPHSTDAMFSRVIERLDQQDRAADDYRRSVKEELAYIRKAVDKTNGRVTLLERWRDTSKAKVAGISLAVGGVGGVLAWLTALLFGHA